MLTGDVLSSEHLETHHLGLANLAYRTGQSVDLTVIGNPVLTLSRVLSFPYHVINGTMVWEEILIIPLANSPTPTEN